MINVKESNEIARMKRMLVFISTRRRRRHGSFSQKEDTPFLGWPAGPKVNGCFDRGCCVTENNTARCTIDSISLFYFITVLLLLLLSMGKWVSVYYLGSCQDLSPGIVAMNKPNAGCGVVLKRECCGECVVSCVTLKRVSSPCPSGVSH